MTSREQIINNMCLTWDHSFGIMEAAEKTAIWNRMAQVFDNAIKIPPGPLANHIMKRRDNIIKEEFVQFQLDNNQLTRITTTRTYTGGGKYIDGTSYEPFNLG